MKKRSVLLAGVLIDLVLAVVLVAAFFFGWPPKEAITPPTTDAAGNIIPGSVGE